MDSAEKYCKQCGKILVSESKLGLCPRCAEKNAKGVGEVALGAMVIGVIIKKIWKPVRSLMKIIIKVK